MMGEGEWGQREGEYRKARRRVGEIGRDKLRELETREWRADGVCAGGVVEIAQ